ncbi:hypothetical protein ARMGADRAFT_528884 [Armillaria gallica]|uniref:DUF6533 domain-containing protein n=1 Tax=Armillaria gallica TaxID=47427 RepID=A0A2H3EA76_ARMGA|nr:hypothetical protein ARMGADRAFT_528884 [Armillaria gallica]
MEFHLFDAVAYIAEPLIIWEYLISIDDEVAFFWSSRRSWIKFLFFVNRYLGIFLRIWNMFIYQYGLVHYICGIAAYQPFNVCYLFIDPESMIYAGIQLVVMKIIMTIRAWAIMGKRHRVLWTFFSLLTLSATVMIIVLPPENHFYFLPDVLFEVIVFAVVAYHEIRYLRNSRSLQSLCAKVSRPRTRSIMQLMFEDSILYFVVIITVLMIVPFMTDTMPLGLSVASITVTRMLLRLRKQALFDSAGLTSVQEELSTFRAVSGGINSSSEGEED